MIASPFFMIAHRSLHNQPVRLNDATVLEKIALIR